MALPLICVVQDPDNIFKTGVYLSGQCKIFALRLEPYGLMSTVALLVVGPRIEKITEALHDVSIKKPAISDPLTREEGERIIQKIHELGEILDMTEQAQSDYWLKAAFPRHSISGVPGGVTSIYESDKDQMDKSDE